MKRVILFGLVLGLLMGGSLAQSWSTQQQEVWSNVETYWRLFADRDLDGFYRYFHSDFLGWSHGDALPRNKESERKWQGVNSTRAVAHEVKPVGIQIYDDIAVVHYYYTLLLKDAEGAERMEKGRWTDVLKKDGTRWVLIADHGGPTLDD